MAKLPYVSPDLLRSYQAEIAKRSTPATYKRKSASLKHFFDWASENGHVPQNPFQTAVQSSVEPVNEPSESENHGHKIVNLGNIIKLGILSAMIVLIFLLLQKLKIPIPFIKTPASTQEITGITSPISPTATPSSQQGQTVILSPWKLFAQLTLTDSSGNPAVGAQTVTFKIYKSPDDPTSLWVSDPQTITTDANGNSLISLDGVPTDLFFKNDKLYLEANLNGAPSSGLRIPISTANVAANLGGYFPGSPTQGAGATTIPVLSDDGSLLLASQSPSVKAISGNLSVEGQAVIISTPNTSSGNITLSPGGYGITQFIYAGNGQNFLNAQAPNLTSGSLFYGLVANNSTGYNLLELQSGSSKTTRFSVDALGNTNLTGALSTSGIQRLTAIGGLTNITGYSQNSGNFNINQGAGDTAIINKNSSALADLLTLSLDERGKANSDYSTLVLKRYNGSSNAYALLVDTGNARFNEQLQLGQYTSNPSAMGQGSLVFNTSDHKVYVWDGSAWTAVGTGSLSFDSITSGINTSATMVVDTGASLNYTNSGTINASSLEGGTWEIPGTIGSGTPNTGAFTTLSSSGNSTIGTGSSTTNTFGTGSSSINTIGSSTTPGALTLHGATILDNTFTVSGSNLTTLGGNLAVNGPASADITSTTTTASLFNSTVTTLNIGGVATGINIGATSGIITLGSNSTINGGSAANDDITLQGTSNSTRTTSYVILQPNGGNVGIGTDSPTSLLSVGASSQFQVNTSGDIVKLKNLTYSWPSSHVTGGFLQDDGAGNLIWTTTVNATAMKWNALTNPDGPLSLSMGTNTTTFTWSAATGSNNLFNLTDTASNTGIGYLLNLTTASGSTLKPFHVSAAGTEAIMVDSTGNVGIGDTTPAATLTVGNGDLFQVAGASGNITTAGNLYVNGGNILTASGNLTLQPAGAGTTANVQIGTGGGGSTTPDFLVIDQDTTNLPAATNGTIVLDATGKFNIYEGGQWKVLCNKTDAACGAGSGAALSAITQAISGNTIANGDNGQIWNWQLTTAGRTAFTFGENIASTATGTPYILNISTLASSTAAPLKVVAQGNTIIDTTAAGNLSLGYASGTFQLTSSGGLNVSTGGALTGVSFLDTIATSATALTFAGAGTLSSTGINPLNLTGGAASTWTIGSGNALTLTSSTIQVSSAGVLSVPGAQSTDITSITAGNALAMQPSVLTTASGTGGALNLSGGNESGTTSTGGAVNINAGTGTTTNGGINIGSATTKTISLGNGTDNTTLTLTGTGLTTLGGNLTVTGTAWTATPTISGLITATSGLTSNGAVTIQNNSNLTMSSGTGVYSQTFSGTTQAPFTLAETFAPGAGGTQIGLTQTITNNPSSSANTLYGNSISITESSNLANTIDGERIRFTDAGSGASTKVGLDINVTTANASDTTYAALFNGGNVGIGTATPNHTLDVNGNIGLAAGSYINWGAIDGSGGYGIRDNGGAIEFKNSGGSWTGIGSGSGTTAWSSLTDPTTDLTLNMGLHVTTWNWNSLTTGTGLTAQSSSLSSGTLASLLVSGTAADSNTQKVLSIGTSGANAVDAQTTYGLYVTNTHTTSVSTNTNVGGYFSASGGTSNYGLLVANGNVGIGDTTPLALLTVGSGDKFQVDSSGNILTAGSVQAGGSASVTYNRFGTNTTGHALDTAPPDPSWNLLVSGKLEVDGTLYLDSATTIANSLGTTTVALSLTPSTTANQLTGASYLVQNNTNVGMAALMVDQTMGGDIFSASSSGVAKFTIANNGDVTINGAAGTNMLTVGSGTGKIDVGTIDPIYNIDGTKYATYLSGMTGVKEETTGTIQTSEYLPGVGYRQVIDFKNLNSGSDLWLFSQATDIKDNIGQMVVLLSPSDNTKTWYQIDKDNYTLSIYSSRPTQISYRLSAPRFDSASWSNLNNDTNVTGFDIHTNTLSGGNSQVPSGLSFADFEIVKNLETGAYSLYQNISDGEKIAVEEFGSFANLVAANVKAGAIESTDFTTQNLYAFQGTVDNLLVKSGLVSPSVKTALISPLPDGKDVTVQIGNLNETEPGKLAIQNNLGKEVAAIDEGGNVYTQGNLTALSATFSGTLKSSSLNTGNATISGVLVADKIQSTTLDDIQKLLKQVENDQNLLSQATNWNVNTASEAGTINYQQLTIGKLFVTDQAAINSLSVSSSVTVGTDLVFSSSVNQSSGLPINSINTLSTPLSLQSLAMAPVEIMAGKFKIATNGDVEISGNLNVAGNIEAKGLTLEDATGSAVANINASGSAQFKEVQTQGITIANPGNSSDNQSTNPSVINTNATIGTGVIPAGTADITINNSTISDITLIYLTATSTTKNNVLYVKEKGSGYFKAGFTDPVDVDVSFNWWIVQAK